MIDLSVGRADLKEANSKKRMKGFKMEIPV